MAEEFPSPASARAAAPIGFWIDVKHQREVVKIIPVGELDLATVVQLQCKLEQLIEARFARIVIDLRAVEFLDSSGLHALVAAHDRAQRNHWRLAIIPGPPAVQRIFELTGTADQLPFVDVNS